MKATRIALEVYADFGGFFYEEDGIWGINDESIVNFGR